MKTKPKSLLSRADLLWSLAALEQTGANSEEQQRTMARLLGFEEKPKSPEQKDFQHILPQFTLPPDKLIEEKLPEFDIQKKPPTSKKYRGSSYYRIKEREQSQQQKTESSEGALALPDWFTQAEPTVLAQSETQIPKIHRRKLIDQPLMPWARLLPWLQRVLGENLESTQIDSDRLVTQFARGQHLRRVPKRKRYTWSPKVRLLIDINADNFPYRKDFLRLQDDLKQWRGDEGLDIQYLYDKAQNLVVRYQQDQEIIEAWQAPHKDTPVLILSDLGQQTQSRRALYQWLVFGQQLVAQGHRAKVLMPLTARDLDKRLLRYFDCYIWDRASRLQRLQFADTYSADRNRQQQSIGDLLSLCFPAVRVDSGLLRAVRHILPAKYYDVGHEAAVWQQAAVHVEGDEWGWQNSSHKVRYQEAYQDNFLDHQHEYLSKKQLERIFALIGYYHALLPDEVYFEAMHSTMQLGLPIPPEVEKATHQYLANLVKTYAERPEHQGLDLWVKRYLARHNEVALRRDHEYLYALMAIERSRAAEKNQQAEIEWPADIPRDKILPFINQKQAAERYVLRQKGMALELLKASQLAIEAEDPWGSVGVTLMQLNLDDTHIFYLQEDEHGQTKQVSLNIASDEVTRFALPPAKEHRFQIGKEIVTVEVLAQNEKPDWVSYQGFTPEGHFYVETLADSGKKSRWYWHPPEYDSTQGYLRGIWYSDLLGELKTPDWADEIGRDRYGVYVDVDLHFSQGWFWNRVEKSFWQRFRWIEPGSFMMGSPESKVGHNEVHHQVILKQGFWLADTTCTQALWKAVMNNNPSRFKGNLNSDDCPVEQVSWQMVQTFIKKVNDKKNARKAGLALRLPTEAEWEYACRAGTTSSYFFGKEVTEKEVNFNRSETIESKRLPCNTWGLYQMHGNVWEWCQDVWQEKLSSSLQKDPVNHARKDQDHNVSRVVRGGSWLDDGSYANSAYRTHNPPYHRNALTGFRLARDH